MSLQRRGPLSVRGLLVVLALSSSSSSLALADEPIGDPPPPPAPASSDEPPPALEPSDDEGPPALPEPVVEQSAPRAGAVVEPRRRARPPGPSLLEVVGLSLGGGAVAAVVAAAGAGTLGGATLATLVMLERSLPEPERSGMALLALVTGAALTPFAAGLVASMAFLFVTRPTAPPEDYAEIAQACLSCAASVACLGLCLTGALVGGPSIILSPSCAHPFAAPPVSGPQNIPALAAGGGAGAGVVVGALASFVLLAPLVAEPLTSASLVVVGAAAGGAAGAFVVGAGAYLVEQWRYVAWAE